MACIVCLEQKIYVQKYIRKKSCEKITLNGEEDIRLRLNPSHSLVSVQPRDNLFCSPRMDQQSALLTPQIPSVDEGLAPWNDGTGPFGPDDPRHQQPQTAPDTLKADDVQQIGKASHSSILESTPNAPSPSPSASIRDSASTHSLPVLQVTEPPSLPQGPDIPSQSDDDSTTPVQTSVVSAASAPPPSRRGNPRYRSTIDVRRFCLMLLPLFSLLMIAILHRVDLPAVSLGFFPSSSIDVTTHPPLLVL